MDARVDPYRLLGLDLGDAHVIRNAGGVVTEEVIRSLAISQHKLGTTEVVLIGHTRCGLEGLDGEEFAARLDEQTDQQRDWSIAAFEDVHQSVRDGIERIKASPFIPNSESVRGFVYDVNTGALEEVT
jgi:carbonic anhydrase